MLLRSAFRALQRALSAVGRRLSERGVTGDNVEEPPDRYVWHRYVTDLCDKCRSKESSRASILVYPDGRIEGREEDIPPLHPNCDCAMRNERTGRFAFGAAGGGPT